VRSSKPRVCSLGIRPGIRKQPVGENLITTLLAGLARLACQAKVLWDSNY
jgi:hypothetical protein